MKSKLVQRIMCFVLASVLLIVDAEIKSYADGIPNKTDSVAIEEIESNIDFSEETDERETEEPAENTDVSEETDDGEAEEPADSEDVTKETDEEEAEEPADSEDVTEEAEVEETGEPIDNTDVSDEMDIEDAADSIDYLAGADSEIFYSELPEVDMTLGAGNVLMGLEGAYYTETAESILKRINEIRLEACREGVRNPVSGRPLTAADYVPMKWSSDLEAIARLRAAEAALVWGHTRPNGYYCFSVRTLSGIQAEAECLASTVGDSATIGWSHFGLMAGIESWYSEKKFLVEGGDGQTGHYEELINPSNRYVGIGAFARDTDGQLKPCTVAGEFSSLAAMDASKNNASGKTIQYIELPATAVLKLMLNESAPDKVEIGSSFQLSISGTVKPRNSSEHTGPIKAGAVWESSDENVLTVDENGVMTALQVGSADISITVGKITGTHTVHVYEKGKGAYQLKRPLKTTYLVGESVNLKGAQIINVATGKTVSLTPDMVSGFDTDSGGVKTLCVVVEGYVLSFDILVVAIPVLTANVGQTLSQLILPRNDYGVWRWDNPAQKLDEAGKHQCKISFTPNDLAVFQEMESLDVEVDVYQNIGMGNAVSVSFYEDSFIYNGTDQRPKVEISFNDKVLRKGADYSLSYVDNRNAGTAKLIITGEGYYFGTVTAQFIIKAAKLEIIAKDRHILCNEPIPQSYDYEVKGLAAGDSLLTAPVMTCDIESTEKSGIYDIIPRDAAADSNYEEVILYRKGRLTVSEEKVSYVVSFNTLRHGKAPADCVGIKAGDTIQPPEEPTEEGYVFGGWYKDMLCTTMWNFDTDTVQSDLTLYACWVTAASADGGSLKLCVQEIPDLTYTGSALKPAVTVYDSDGTSLLKLGKDYTVKYVRNTDAVAVGEDGKPVVAGGTAKVMNPGKASETITDLIGQFSRECPYVVITGKGNYTETIYRNFRILPADIAAEETGPAKDPGNTPLAAGFILKYTDQFEAKSNKAAKIVSSFKYKKALKDGKDYVLSVQDRNGTNVALTQGKLPLNAGNYTLTVTGKGNYTGSVRRKLYVAGKQKLMKNVSIVLGKNQRAHPYTGEAVLLTPGYYDPVTKKKYKVTAEGMVSSAAEADAKDMFLVKVGQESLIWGEDYTIDYAGTNLAVGTATMILTGKNGFVGSKSVTFKITGRAFSAKTVEVKTDDGSIQDGSGWKAAMTYTGRALTQNKVTLTTKVDKANPTARELTYGEDYTITYKNNVKKGTAAMTFTAKPESGFSGSFKKNFKINAQELSKNKLTVLTQAGAAAEAVYCKSGAQLPFEIRNEAGTVLREGTDYTVKYKNNNAVTTAQTAENKRPLMTVTGKGNYAGKVEVPFSVISASIELALDEQIVSVSCVQVAKKDNMSLKDFKFKLVEGKKALGMGETKDYILDDTDCTPDRIKAYADAIAAGTAALPSEPAVTVKGRGSYSGEKTILLGKYIYADKLTTACLYVVVSEGIGQNIYTGGQVTPDVAVYYGEKTAVSAAKKDKVKDGAVLTDSAGKYKLTKLSENSDYTLYYGANITAGNNKGSVTVTGAGRYGGSVTVKFTIAKKAIY